ncbi:MAG: FkbM family methyltransferase [Pseudomonadota bacterium]
MISPAVRGAEAGVPDGMAAFGAYALSPGREGLRRYAQSLGRSGLARRACSVIRRIVTAGRAGPFDVEAFPGQMARLYPDQNLSDKRVFAGVQFWDWVERSSLGDAVRAADEPVYFVDAGANAGLYTLSVRAEAQGKSIRILAIEPDPENLARLQFNLAASDASEVTVAPVALSDQAGTAHITVDHANRGELSLADKGTQVTTRPLLDLVVEAGFPRIDALKIDIEGIEDRVLAHFLDNAPPALLPHLVVIEAQRGADTPALARLLAANYVMAKRTKMNAVLCLGPVGTEG